MREVSGTEKYDWECNLFVAFLFVLPVFGALLWAEVWARWVFYLISVKCNSCEWLCYAENQMWNCGIVGFSSELLLSPIKESQTS